MVSLAAGLFSDDFNTTGSAANYNVFQTTGASSANTGSAAFAFDYSTLGIPSAQNSLGDSSTLGLRVQSDQLTATTSDIIGAISVVTKNLSLPAQYKVSVEVWGNYVGGTTIGDAGGTNSTTGPTFGIGSTGTTYDSATTNAAQGGVLVDALRDPSASGGTYRVYINGVNQGNSNGNYSIYTASGGSNAATTAQMYTNSYYGPIFPSVSAPSVQSTAASTQTGSTPAGVFGFAWHNETLTNDGTNTTWAIDGNIIAVVPNSSVTTYSGSQIALGDQDGNTGIGPATYNFNVFDDLLVTAIPEPASLMLVALAAGLCVRRRSR
jgi:hypothetical protein